MQFYARHSIKQSIIVWQLEPMKNEYAEAMVSPAAKYLLINTPFSADAMADEAQNAPVTAVGEPSTQSPFLNLIRLDAESTNGPLVCVCQLDIDAIGMPASIKGMIQAKIDRLEEIDQTLVKTAAILGRRFSRKMLKSLLQVSIFTCCIGERLNNKIFYQI